MADEKISAMPAAAAVGGTDLLAGVQAGANVKVTAAQVKTFTSASPTLVTPDLGTPSAGIATNLTGTAAGLTAGTVTTNANLIGPITSVGNATSLATQTGTGSRIVVDTSPTLVTPILGVATATSINKVVLTAPASGATLTIANGKTLTVNGTVTFAVGADGQTFTFPSTSATVARTDAAQTFTGVQTFSTPIAVGSGGTGAATFAANGILYGNDASPLGVTAVGTAGQVLTSNGTGVAPTFQASAGGTPSGTAGGDLGSTYPNPTVISVSNITTGTLGVTHGGTGVTTSTGTGNTVLSTSPTLVTPALGVATATSLNGNTFTTGTYTLTGTAGKTLNFTNTLTFSGTDSTVMTFPTTTATIARTDAAQSFTGTQTISSGNLAVTSGNISLQNSGTITYTGRGIITSPAAGSIQLGAADAASPVAQSFSAQSVVTGTSNTAGTNLTVKASRGTGTGAGGDIIFQVAPAGSTGTTVNTLATAFTVSNTGVPKLPSFTVATLPSASGAGAGAIAYVTDALTPAFGVTLTGGSSTPTPCYSDGTNWRAG